MKKKLSVFAVALCTAVSTYAADTLYVRNGCALDQAIKEARAIHATCAEPVTISMAPGTWTITRPIHLTPEDSHLKFVGAGMGKTIISGAVKAPQWKVGEDGVWTVDLSYMMPAGGSVPQLYVGGQRAVCARTPNGIAMIPTPEFEETLISAKAKSCDHRSSLAVSKLHVGDLLDGIDISRASGHLRINYHHAWDVTRRYLWGYDPAAKDLYHFGNGQKAWNPTNRSSQLYFDNDRMFLDAPGEFYYDENRAMLYYIPREGQDPAIDRAEIPCARRIVHIKGSENQRVSDISFEGLTFCETRYDIPYSGYDPEQGAASEDAAVFANFADGINFKDCEVSLTGNCGIWFRTSCQDCSVKNCYLHDLGIGGVKIGDNHYPDNPAVPLTSRVCVDNCIITAGGREVATAIGVLVFHASDCEITHNEISDFYYSGVSVGWIWGFTPDSPAKRNNVSYNHIHHLGWGLLSDMGAVYTLGKSEGTVISHNHIHDVFSYTYGGWGLYNDEGSTGITMEYNLVYHCKYAGYHQHYGRDNLIANNIFYDCLRDQVAAGRAEEPFSLTFERNVLWFRTGRFYGTKWNELNSVCGHNLYWNPETEAFINNGKTLKQWTEETGKDASSIVADPQFADPENGDFTMRNKRALKKIGFKVFDPSEAGVYGTEEWKRLAQMPEERIVLYNETVARYLAQSE